MKKEGERGGRGSDRDGEREGEGIESNMALPSFICLHLLLVLLSPLRSLLSHVSTCHTSLATRGMAVSLHTSRPKVSKIIIVSCKHCHLPACCLVCTTLLYCTVLYCVLLYCTVLYCVLLYCTVLYCVLLYCTVLYGARCVLL